MKKPLNLLFWVFLFSFLQSCTGQNTTSSAAEEPPRIAMGRVGGPCDGCEIMYVGMPEEIPSVSYSPGWEEEGQKLLVSGTVYETDGKTVASDIIIYYWHTDSKGEYSPVDDMPSKARRHGHIRGWVKSDKDGRFSIYTIRPVLYPSRTEPAHIHTLIQEPDLENEYYIDAWVFEDDPMLTEEVKKSYDQRGGDGILSVKNNDSLQVVEPKVILGRNIPGYPQR